MLNRIRWKIQSFMIGRNGFDELNRILIYIALGCDLVAIVINSWLPVPGTVIAWLSYIICGVFIYRAFSKQISKRRKENDRYKSFIGLWRLRLTQGKQYKVFSCRGCGKNIRIPRGKGKIEVRCPVCGDITIHRT